MALAELKLTVTVDQQVNGGTVYFNIKYLGYILVLKETMDLCDLAAEMEVSCPLSSGVYEQYVADTFPDYAYSVSVYHA